MANIEVNTGNYKAIKKLFDKAVRDGKESFVYDGLELVTAYAKYLLEYMETILKIKK